MHTPRLEIGVVDLLKFGVIDLLKFGVVDLLISCVVDLENGVGVVVLEFGVAGLLERDPVRKSGNRCGETVRFSGTTEIVIIKRIRKHKSVEKIIKSTL